MIRTKVMFMKQDKEFAVKLAIILCKWHRADRVPLVDGAFQLSPVVFRVPFHLADFG